MVDNFDTDKFISEIEFRPAIWNTECPEYSNRNDKSRAWDQLCNIFYENLEQKKPAEINEISRQLQRRWKSLRDCYVREKNIQRKEKKSGRAKVNRRQYVYFNRLMFLKPTVLNKETDLNRSDESRQEDDESASQNKETKYSPNEAKTVEDAGLEVVSNHLLKRKKNEVQAAEHKLLPVATQHFSKGTQEATKKREDDEDKLFFLSLVKEMKKVPEDNRLDVKMDFIQVLKKWQRTPQMTNQFYQAPASLHNNCQQQNQAVEMEHKEIAVKQELGVDGGSVQIQDENVESCAVSDRWERVSVKVEPICEITIENHDVQLDEKHVRHTQGDTTMVLPCEGLQSAQGAQRLGCQDDHVPSATIVEKSSHRAVIQYLQKKGLSPKDIYEDMLTTLKDDAPAYATVKKWAAKFKRGRESLEDDPRSGRPRKVTHQSDTKQLTKQYKLTSSSPFKAGQVCSISEQDDDDDDDDICGPECRDNINGGIYTKLPDSNGVLLCTVADVVT